MRTEAEDLLILYEEYLTTLGRSIITIKDYLSNLKLFRKWYRETYEVKAIDFSLVKEIDLLSYRNHLQYEKRYKTATTNQHIAALRSFFSFLHSKGVIGESVINDLSPLSKPYIRAPDVPKRAQILKLFRIVDTSNDRGKRDFAILQLFVQCGLRLSEVADIELADIDMDERKGVLRIAGGKGDQPREISLNKTVRHALKAYLGVRQALPDTKELFISQLRKPLSRRSIYHLTKKHLEAAGMPDLSCHDLNIYLPQIYTIATRTYFWLRKHWDTRRWRARYAIAIRPKKKSLRLWRTAI